MPNSLTFFAVSGDFQAVTNPAIAGSSPYPVVMPVSGLVHFTPRLPKGMLFYVDDYLVTVAYNTRQTIQLLDNPASGTWKLYLGDPPTGTLTINTTPAQLKTYLEAQADIGVGNVIVLPGIAPFSYDVEFTGTFATTTVPPLTADSLLLDVLANPTPISVAVTDLGTPQISRDTAVAVPPITARIWAGVLSTIDTTDTPTIELTANSAVLGYVDDVGNPADLIYDVMFDAVTYNGVGQSIAPFAFVAPIDATPLCITDPALERLPWQPPINVAWKPPVPASPGLRAVS